jgi:hypothetical protein
LVVNVINLDYSVSFDSPDINDNTNDNTTMFDAAGLSICQVFTMVYLQVITKVPQSFW